MASSNQKQSRRDQILQALAHMLETSPGQRITTARLAAEVGVSEAALYRHFPSKARMFEGLIDFIEDSLLSRVNLIMAEEKDTMARCHHILQLLLVEFIIDVLKLASLNTPDVLSNSFSMLGALILGDFAVQARWLVPEVLVYMAFVAIANYAQHSYEMGYAVKLCRMALLLLIWLFDWWGFIGGILGILALVASTRPLIGKGYLYPLIPFNGKDLWALLHHRPIDRNNS